MSKVHITIWDREFDIPISYSCYPGEKVTDIQKHAVEEFIDNDKQISGTLADIKKYVEKTNDIGMKANELDNIFKYVMPKSLFVPRTSKETVAIICNYKFDMENGIAVVFENGKLKSIGTQDTII